MNELITIIIVGILILCIFLQYESTHAELTYVTSNIDGEKYLVRNKEDKIQAADKIATIKKNLSEIVNYLKENVG